MSEIGPWIWLVMVAGGALALGLLMGYGIWATGHLSLSKRRRAEQGAREIYDKEDADRPNPDGAANADGTVSTSPVSDPQPDPGPHGLRHPARVRDGVEETGTSVPVNDPPARY